MRTRDQSKTVLTLYEQDFEQHDSQPSYQKFKTMVKRCMDQKIRARRFEARNEKIETGAPAKDKRKLDSLDRKQGECDQWQAKGQCTRGAAKSFRHKENKRGKTTRSLSPAPEPQTNSDGKFFFEREVSQRSDGARLERDLEDDGKITSVGNARTS